MKVIYSEIERIEEFVDIVRIRINVFTIEQKSKPGRELDKHDKAARHFIAIANGKIVSAARVRKSAESEFKIGRMATLKEYRKKGISRGLLKYIIKELLKISPKRIWLQAQVEAQMFYKNCGFKAISKPYILWGKPHVDMEFRV